MCVDGVSVMFVGGSAASNDGDDDSLCDTINVGLTQSIDTVISRPLLFKYKWL